MSMFGPKRGTWIIRSKKDPRWDASGRGYGLVCAGGTSEQSQWVEECKKKYGEPPDDLTTEFWKD